ncbi:adh short, KR and/or Epimerase domain containing protein [Asbolus verrucosus]|uniref:Adh short, KR and/or Epimerase domain containing protein n=1 Tax=Asbolus verrucosus TaxID=1661398 RepID=A0A482VIX9_ASBVE|nr:adh short, KR and/or Epimerase domain containing protein [Asbolus verrucosus]
MVLSMERWVGKVAIVTGASEGIGAAIVDQLVEYGLIVVGMARRVGLMEQCAEELGDKKGKLHPYKVDLTKEEEVLEAFKWVEDNVGPVHILVNNAGVCKSTSLYDGNIDDWRYVINLNLLAVCIGSKEAIRVMRENQINGHIINVNSIYGHRVPSYPGINMYSPTKHALTCYTEYLRREFNSIGCRIKLTSLSPGFVTTEMTVLNPNDTIRELLKTFPMLKSEDVADAAIFALSTPEDVDVHELTIKPIGEME